MWDIQLWETWFHIQLAEFLMADQTYKIEWRINKVTINAKYESLTEPQQFSFKILDKHTVCTSDDLFLTEDKAMQELLLRISSIEIITTKESEIENID